MQKKTVYIIIAIVLVIVIVLITGKKQGWIGKTYATKVAVEEAQNRTITELVTANGKIQPEIEVNITPYISGEVVELGVKEGDEVSKGDFLAKIDPEIYISAYERAEANLNTQKANEANARARVAQAEAQFVQAKNEFRRNKQLYDQEVISEAEFDAAKSSYEVAKAEVEAARESLKAAQFNVKSSEASLNEARENLTRTSIYAPTDGTVSRLNVEEGERVTGASQFSAGTELMRIANLKKMEVNVDVNENDIIRIKRNDTAIIEVDAYFKQHFKGIVTEIATSAKETAGASTDQVTNFDVKISILPSSYENLMEQQTLVKSPFRPGMSASVDIQTKTVYNVPSVPIQSVIAKADTTESEAAKDELNEYAFVVKEGEVEQRKIISGVQDNEYIQIVEGLASGEQVVTAPYRTITRKLKEGTKVEIVDKDDLFAEE
jgi:HlyD family secretion protein